MKDNHCFELAAHLFKFFQ